MKIVRRNAYCKLNLTLDVLGRAEGYHMLDSLAVTVDLCDKVVLKRRKDEKFTVSMRGMGSEQLFPEENNALLAARKFQARFETDGADITIWKSIPFSAGLGGSSADSAAVIAGMGALFSVKDRAALKEVADACGSDTGFLLEGGLARLRGRGEEIERLPFRKFHFLLLLPEKGVSTAEAFARFDEMGLRGGKRTEEAVSLLENAPAWAAKCFGNDLYPAAKALCPAVEEAYLEAKALSPLGASMTGSGSAVFAVFETEELALWAASKVKKFRTLVLESVLPREKSIKSPFVLGEGEEEE